MLMELSAAGANELWEYSLLLMPDSGKSRKPRAADASIKKQEFIQSKHKHLSFIPRLSDRTNGAATSTRYAAEQVNEELHSTVRTAAVKEVLRLLVLGAGKCALSFGRLTLAVINTRFNAL